MPLLQFNRTWLLVLGCAIATGVGAWWVSTQHAYLLENPSWLFGKPSDETFVQTLPSWEDLDYRPLRSQLQAQAWEQADTETTRAIISLLRQKLQEMPLSRTQGIAALPCTDLYTLDRLWRKYSNGQFGFSVQRQIIEADKQLPSPKALQDRCMKQCQNPNCVQGCLAKRIRLEVTRIPERMGRGFISWKPDQSGKPTQPPAGYYPSIGIYWKSTFSNSHPYTYQAFARRSAQCKL